MKRKFKGSFLWLTSLNPLTKKKSELGSKLVLRDGKLTNCPRVSKDFAHNSGYQEGWFLLAALFWALGKSSLLLGVGGRCTKLMSVGAERGSRIRDSVAVFPHFTPLLPQSKEAGRQNSSENPSGA